MQKRDIPGAYRILYPIIFREKNQELEAKKKLEDDNNKNDKLKLESENRRLRGELQEMHKTVTKLHYERDEAYIHEQQVT